MVQGVGDQSLEVGGWRLEEVGEVTGSIQINSPVLFFLLLHVSCFMFYFHTSFSCFIFMDHGHISKIYQA
jgi:hypothetical protein